MSIVRLRWDHLTTNSQKMFCYYRREKKYTDVIILVDDKKIHAHQMILSVGSKYFRDIFENASGVSPVIVAVKGFTYSEVVRVIDFLYTGTITLSHKHAKKFRETAKSFGLFGMNNLYVANNGVKDKPKFVYLRNCSVRLSVLKQSVIEKHTNPANIVIKTENF